MKGFRNILVHGYTKLDNAKVFSHICAGKTDIYQFIEEVTTFLNISDNQKM